ncbi:YcxB family protein [Hydrogenophaga sp. 5NK40-0174]|uniref:YcxB family protein n=1 Tax=Hydrogenophaga sp. 5NK40-0174 TaxID=3127649 RepID=UPI003108948E
MQAEYRFEFSEDHLLTSLLRYRQQIWWRRLFLALKWVLAAAFAIPMLVAIYMGVPALAGLFGAVLFALVLGWPIDAWLIRRRFRNSPYHGDNIVLSLSDGGVRIVGRSSDSQIAWSAFTKARRFRDGVLLFQGPGMFNWLPDSAALEPTTLEVAQKLVRSNVGDYRDA